jgi:hypothetical protein
MLSEIMTDPQCIDPMYLTEELAAISRKTKKTDEDKAILAPLWEKSLSVGAKTCIERIAKQLIYGYEEQFTSKQTDKGTQVEDAAIELYNSVFFTNYKKNTERKTNEWLTGECDIVAPKKIVDIKAPWSLATFPATIAAGVDKGYEWQGRAYMMLWDRDEFEIAYCMVSTPDELIGYESTDLHYVDHINPELRVTRVQYQRDKALEDRIKNRCEEANKYLSMLVKKIADEHAAA